MEDVALGEVAITEEALVTIYAIGIVSAEHFGYPSAVDRLPVGIASAEAFGTPIIGIPAVYLPVSRI